MLTGLETRGAAVGARAADAAAAPQCGIVREGRDVIVTGGGLADDPRLRWIGSLLR